MNGSLVHPQLSANALYSYNIASLEIEFLLYYLIAGICYPHEGAEPGSGNIAGA